MTSVAVAAVTNAAERAVTRVVADEAAMRVMTSVMASVRAEMVGAGWKNEIKGSPSRGDACVSVKSGGTR